MLRGPPHEAQVLPRIGDLWVQDMDDGGMGSIRILTGRTGPRRFGQQIAGAGFVDQNGVFVSATLNVDQHGDLYELDLWKVDSSRLCRYPADGAISTVPQ